MSDWIYVCPLL